MFEEVVVSYGSRNATLYDGWVPQPNGRGTIDIIWSCFFTIFLSSWSILCVNLPAEHEGFWRRARRKFQWTLLIIMGPEIIFQLSLGEWLQARKWAREFKKSGYEGWTMTHSFYANMGGFILHTPDHGSFPVNAAQLHYLLIKGHLQYPDLSRKRILDKNKAEAVVRVLTLGQTVWFLLNCVARAAQGLALTSIELSTLAFILSAIGSFFCWFHKPMDVETPDTLQINITIAEIQRQGGCPDDNSWTRTPLDFIDRKREWPWNLYWHYGMAIIRRTFRMSWLVLRPQRRPFERLPDDYWPEPTLQSLPALFVFHVGYASILMAGWNLDLPTYTELLLWRISTSIQLGTIVSGWLTMPLQIQNVPPRLQRLFAFAAKEREHFRSKRAEVVSTQIRTWYSRDSVVEVVKTQAEKARTLISDDPNWKVSLRLLLVYELTWLVYLTTRLYIVVEDFASLRAMPVSAFDTVNWSVYLPHI